MAESAVTFLLNNLSTFLQHEQNLLGGLKSEVQKITDDLQLMRAFLRVADSKEGDDPVLDVWTRQVCDIAYDLEDVLDQYKLQFANGGANGFRARIKKIYGSIKGLKPRHQIASQIQEIKSRVGNASQSYLMFKDKYLVKDQDETCYDGREDALYLLDTDVVGIENPKSELLRWLKSTEGGLNVISVVGMGGMGKTTLVKKVYDDRSLKGNFTHHVWITVSESYKVEDLLARMIKLLYDEIKQPIPQRLDSMNAEEMRRFINNFLQGKTFIVVLDDIWKIHAWESIRNAFPRNSANSQGCIIITTRDKSIADAASFDKRHVYNLECLSDEDAKLLFNKKVFHGNSCPVHFTKIYESILKKCNGLPLAIVVIGGLLATKNNNIQAWEMFNHSIGDELEGDGLKRLNKIISLSFYDLPYYLKSCFLYLSIFPEDKLLQKWKLIQLWAVEGFVQESRGKTMEEVAEGYLNELVNRSLIQVVGTHLDGTVESFRIHDLLREYIVSKTKDGIFIVGDRGDVRWPDKIRRISLDASSKMQESYTFDHLRTLLWLSSKWRPHFELSEIILQKVLGRRGRLLKVLDFTGAPLKSIPYEVFKLYHLKYLNLRWTRVTCIPKSIKNLVNLETLDANNTLVTQLPNEVVKLKKLRHLLVGPGIISAKGPTDIGSLTSLQTLMYLSDEDVKIVREIGKLTQLRILSLTNIKRKDGKDLCSSISKLYNLQELCLCALEGNVLDLEHPMMMSASSLPFLRFLHLDGRLQKIPSWTSSLFGLTELYLLGSRLCGDQDPLELIQVLPSLLSLELTSSAYEGEGLIFRTQGFQRLKKLKLSKLVNLRWVKVEEGCMPHLQELIMRKCLSMLEEPEGLQHLLHLQSAEFEEMSKEFVTKVNQKRKEKEWELGHVPKVVVR